MAQFNQMIDLKLEDITVHNFLEELIPVDSNWFLSIASSAWLNNDVSFVFNILSTTHVHILLSYLHVIASFFAFLHYHLTFTLSDPHASYFLLFQHISVYLHPIKHRFYNSQHSQYNICACIDTEFWVCIFYYIIFSILCQLVHYHI